MSRCWDHTGYVMPNGYGQVWDPEAKKVKLAHRVSYEYLVGPIPAGLDIDHLCRNRKCYNPDHLEPVTRSENLRRGDMNRGGEIVHGTRSMYVKHRCRCDPCRASEREYSRKRRK